MEKKSVLKSLFDDEQMIEDLSAKQGQVEDVILEALYKRIGLQPDGPAAAELRITLQDGLDNAFWNEVEEVLKYLKYNHLMVGEE